MTSKTATRHGDAHRREVLAAVRTTQTRRRRRNLVMSGVVLVAVAGLVAAMMLRSRPASSTVTRAAPDFTLTNTSGKQVHLGDYRGHNVLLYFSEGAGCGACSQQMAAIEKDKAAFGKANVVVLPVVMNTREQIVADMALWLLLIGVLLAWYLLGVAHIARDEEPPEDQGSSPPGADEPIPAGPPANRPG